MCCLATYERISLHLHDLISTKELEIKIPSRTEIYSLDVTGMRNGIYLIVIREGQIIRNSAKFMIAK